MDRIVKLFATAALAMTVLLAVSAPLPASAMPADVSLSLPGAAPAGPCLPFGAIASLSPTLAPEVIEPKASTQQEGEEEENDPTFEIECELGGTLDVSYDADTGTLTLEVCSPENDDGDHEIVECTLVTGNNEVVMTLTGCTEFAITISKD